MAGSMSWGLYRSDNNRVYSIKLDKSNMRSRLSTTGNPCVDARDRNAPPLPCGLKPRYVYTYDRENPKRKRKFVLDTTVGLWTDAYNGEIYVVTLDDNALWLVTGYVGETYLRLPRYYAQPDTGLTDGTVSQ
jgi:hypothetical protein